MRQLGPLAAVAAALLFVSCRAEPAKNRVTPEAFVRSTMATLQAEQQLAAVAVRRGSTPEAREVAAGTGQRAKVMQVQLAAIAQRRGIMTPASLEEKKQALAANLAILTGRDFDRGYVLAMLQDLNAMSVTFRAAADSGDAEVAAFARAQLGTIERSRKETAAALSRLGGSPFGFVP